MNDTVDTGFDAVIAGESWTEPVTVAVTEPDPPAPPTEHLPQVGLTAEGVQAAKALVALPDLKPPELAALAREMAMDIRERSVILKAHNLTEAQYDWLETHNEYYRNTLESACREWHSPMSTEDRIKIQSAAILEETLPGLGARMQNRAEGLPGVVEAAKLFAKVAGVGERATAGGPAGERFVINIDLGGDQKITVASSPAPAQPANPGILSAIRDDDEGTPSLLTLQKVGQG